MAVIPAADIRAAPAILAQRLLRASSVPSSIPDVPYEPGQLFCGTSSMTAIPSRLPSLWLWILALPEEGDGAFVEG